MPLPPAPTISSVSSMSMSQSKKNHSVSDFSDLFGDESDSSSLFSSLSQPTAPNLSTSFSGSLASDPSGGGNKHLGEHFGSQSQSMSNLKTESPYKSKREEQQDKRKSSEKLSSEDK